MFLLVQFSTYPLLAFSEFGKGQRAR